MKVEIGFDLSANGQGSYFTLDDATKGVLDGATYVLGGDVLVDVTSDVRAVQVKRGRSRTLSKFTAGAANITLSNRTRKYDPTYAPTSTTRTNLVLNPSLESATTGWLTTSETSDDLEAKAILAGATFWIDAAFASSSQTVTNLGTGGTALNATLGSGTAVDSNDPQWLPYAGTPYVYLPGANSNLITAPDETALDIAGDLTLICRVAFDDWTPSSTQRIIGKWQNTSNRSYALNLDTSGKLVFIWSEDTTAQKTAVSTTAPTTVDGTAYWVAVTLDVDNGAVGNDVRFFYAADQSTVPSSWTQIGSTVTTAGVTSIGNSSVVFSMGGDGPGFSSMAVGKFYRGLVLSGIGAAGVPKTSGAVLDADCSVLTSGAATSFTAATGQTVTINRGTSGRKSAVVVKSRWLHGTDDYAFVSSAAGINYDASTSFSIMWSGREWATPTSGGALVAKRTTGQGYALTQTTTTHGATFTISDGVNSATATSPASSSGAARTFVAVVNRSTNFLTVYADGVAGTPVSISSVGSLSNSEELRIGRLSGASTSYQDFEHEATGVFPSALSAASVSAISTYYSGRAAYTTASPTLVSDGVYGLKSGSFTNTSGYSTLGVVYASATVTAGTGYIGSLYAKGTTASCRVVLDWYGASGYISRSTGTASAAKTSEWTRYSATGTAPVGATSVQVRLDMAANATAPVYVDSALVETGSTLNAYFDGTYSDGSIRYTSRSWSGATDASTSSITAYVTGTGSPYYGSIVPRKQVRISHNDLTIYTGMVADWNFDYDVNGDSVALPSATDGFALLAGQNRNAGTATSQASGARIGAVLDEAGWPTTQRSIDTGQATLGADVVTDAENVLAYLQKVETSEPGALFVGKTGNLVFKDRATLQTYTSGIAFGTGGVPFTNISVEYGIESMTNSVTVTYTGGTSTATDSASQTLYGTLDESVDTLLADSASGSALANWLVSLYSDPQYRINGLTVNLAGLTSAQVLSVLGLELGDVVVVTWTPNSTGSALSQTVTIDSIEHSATPAGHTIAFGMSPTSAAFLLDSSASGVLDANALGF